MSSNGSAGLRPRLIGFDTGRDPLHPGFVQVFRGEAKTGGKSLFAPNPFSHPVLGFHSSMLSIAPPAVHQTGQLGAFFRESASRQIGPIASIDLL